MIGGGTNDARGAYVPALLAAVIFALLFVSSAFAEEAAQIKGEVTSAATKAPLAGVTVCTERMDDTGPWICATTNTGGEYSVHLVSGGDYHVEFKAPAPSGYIARTFYDGTFLFPEAAIVSVPEGGATLGIDAELEEPGEIDGKVTSASTKAPVEGIYVCAGEPPEGNRICDTTNAQGEYTISGLPGRAYYVEFDAGDVNYLTQFYSDKYSRTEAQPVSIVSGAKVSGVDAELVKIEGGGLTGTVLSAETEKPIAGIEVCAYESGDEGLFGECAKTESRGEYTITGLTGGGQYVVEFSSPSDSGLNYITQFYNGEASASEANAIGITAGSLNPGIDARLKEGGRIAGEVVDAAGKAPVAGIEVCAFATQSESLGCATTGSNGEYVVAGLAHGPYLVEFFSPTQSGLDYLTQYYGDTPLPSEADTVLVEEGGTRSGIDAELQAGGRIEGRVTNTSTNTALNDVLVCVLVSVTEAAGCGATDASGEYTTPVVPSGAYEVGFDAGKGYTIQYYEDKPSFVAAQRVSISAGKTTAGIDAAMGSGLVPSALVAPVNTMAPVTFGEPAVGEYLSCANGLWAGSPTPTFTRQWLRNSAPIAGATGNDYQVQGADEGAGLACEVIAKSIAGEASATSAAITIPESLSATAPVATAVIPTAGAPKAIPLPITLPVTVEGSRIVVAGNSAAVRLKCNMATSCRGSIELTVLIPAKRREAATATSHQETLVLAKGSFSLRTGKSATVLLRLTSTGKQRLADAKHHPVAARLILSVQGAKTTTAPVLAR